MGDTTQLVKDYQEKRSKLVKFMKNPQHDASLLSNSLEFRDKNIQFFASGGIRTSKFDKLENHPFLGYPYKRGIKRVIQEAKANEIHYEPHVEAGGGEDLYGICTDIDEFSKTATIVLITNNFEGYLVAKDSTPKAKDKLPNEQVDKDSTDIAHSYIDFVLGGLLATKKTILQVHIKQS
ncbi:DUF228 domain-containing protein [Borreliella bavariensis]|uniref:DUF228 domain-containing protein n=1 Tax=Borreliella bavariensis TaxID=664662 RepID=UPI001F209C27|nr:DUF228 domain-containing protein [Borreliella bavariensis]